MGQKVINNYILDIENCADLLKETTNTVLFEDEMYYNCGGFALGVFNWYRPYDHDEKELIHSIIEDYYDELINELDACNEIADIYISHMEKAGLCREILSENDLNENEYLVAFKSAINDFHYVRRLRNGRWFHKLGWDKIEEVFKDDVYDDMWWEDLNCYCGNLRLLAVKY